MKKVSIVIPFYNNPEFLREMIESVINQSYRNWELHLVDDGADKVTLECAESFQLKDSRIKIIKRQRLPKGAQTCRNIGLQNSTGDYICFFDSDDILLPNCLANRVRYMEEHKYLDFAVFRAQTYDVNDKNKIHYFGKGQSSDDLKYFILGILPFAVWTNIYKRESLLKSGAMWDENILSLQDSAFNIQNITVNELKYSYDDSKEVDYLWRINHNNNSITKNIQSKEHNKSHLYFLQAIISNVKEKFNNKYDSDLALRAFDFCLKFINNGDLDSVRALQQTAVRNNMCFNNFKLYKIYSFLNNKISNKRFLRYFIFPIYSYQLRRNIKKFLQETKLD